MIKVCGLNKQFQLSESSNNEDLIQKDPVVNPPCDFRIDLTSLLSISFYYLQTVWVTRDKRAFAIGSNDNRLIISNLPSETFQTEREIKIQDSEGRPFNFLSVVCGEKYTLYRVSLQTNFTNSHLVYQHENQEYIFLNINGRETLSLFGGDTNSAIIDTEGGIIVINKSVLNHPEKPLLPTFLPNGEKAVSIACCNKFILALGTSCHVFESQIDPDDECELNFKLVDELFDIEIIQISGTYDHVFAVAKDGRVFGRGDNKFGQLAMGKNVESVDRFTEVVSLLKYQIKYISAGAFHSLFQTSEGKVLACGNNLLGQLPLSNGLKKKLVHTPVETIFTENSTFCIAGVGETAIFIGLPPPLTTPNLKVSKKLRRESKVKSSKLKIKKEQKIEQPKIEDEQPKIEKINDEHKEEAIQKEEEVVKQEKKEEVVDIQEEEEVNDEKEDTRKDKSSDSGSKSEDEKKSDSDSNSEKEKKSDSSSNSENEKKSDSSSSSDDEQKNDSESKSEKEQESDSESKSEKEKESDSGSKSEDEQKSDSESKSDDEKKSERDQKSEDEQKSDSEQKSDDDQKSRSQHPNVTNEEILRALSGSKNDSKSANDNEVIESLKRENEELKLKIKMLEKTQNQQQNRQQNIINHLDSNMIHNLRTVEEIGSSFSGKVIEVVKEEKYALKEMKPIDSKSQNQPQYFSDHEKLNSIHHPNIIKTYGIHLSDEKMPLSILLELCQKDLVAALKSGTLNNETIVKYIYQIAEGMKFAHSCGFIHRDLKPSNILIGIDGDIKISEFGIPSLMTTEEQSLLLSAASQKFMAPELLNEEDYNEKVDVYSFGVVLFFLLSDGQMPKITVVQMGNGKKAPIPDTFTDFATNLINKCWETNPNNRPSFEKILELLETNNYHLLEINNSEVDNIRKFVAQHKKKIPQY